SALRIEIDSQPAELDTLNRRIMQLEIEQTALKKEKDKASQERLAKLQQELAGLREEANTLTARWKNEKDAIGTPSLLDFPCAFPIKVMGKTQAGFAQAISCPGAGGRP
ncbi:MAG: DUF493 family protein, partial [Sphingopyxis sp.]|nr:DUF493 family protein [Sphingopyxis sp.]